MTDDNRQPLDHLEEVLNGMGFPHERTEETITLRVSFDSDGVNWDITIVFTAAPSGIFFHSPLGLTDSPHDSVLEVVNRWNAEMLLPKVSIADQGDLGEVVTGEGLLTGEASADGIKFIQQSLIQCVAALISQVTLRPLPVEEDGTDPELKRLVDMLASATTKSDELDVLRELHEYYEMHGLWKDMVNCDFSLGNVEISLGQEARGRNEHVEAVERFEEASANFLQAKMYYSNPENPMLLGVANCDFNLGMVHHFLGQEARGRNEHIQVVRYSEEARASYLAAKMYYSDPKHLMPLNVANCDANFGIMHHFLGEEARYRNDHVEAVEHFEKALANFLQAKMYYSDPENPMLLGVARCDLNIGTMHRLLGVEARDRNDHAEAVEHFEKARASYLEAKMYYSDPQHLKPHDVANCDFNLGLVEHALGEEAKDRNEHAETVGHFEEARAIYLAARKYYSDPENPMLHDVANCDFELGHVERYLGQEARARNEHVDAVEHFEKARASYLEAKMYYSDPQHLKPHDVANCDFNLGLVEHALGEEAKDRNEHAETVGHFEEARKSYLAARMCYSDPENPMLHDVANCDLNIGIMHHFLGEEARYRNDHVEAVGYLEKARGNFLQAKMYYSDPQHLMSLDVANCDHGLGNVELLIGNYGSARDYYKAARLYFEAHKLWENVADCDFNLASVAQQLRLPADAASLAISAMTIYDHLYYQLRSYSDRLLWANRHAEMLDIALLAALEDRDDRRVVEIIESARIQSLPAPETTSTELAGIVTHSPAHAQIASTADTAPLDAGISLASVAAQGSLAGDPLGPPHGVRLGDGDSLAKSVGIDVSELLGTDNIPEVVNIAEIAKLVGGDNAYWFGSWVSGGALYWYLLGPSGVMDIGNVAMEYLHPLLGQLAQGLPDRLSEEEDDEALGRRVFDSLFFDRERELDLAWSLGEALMPEVLRKLLSTLNESEPISLVIAPAPEIAHVPFPWLSVDEKGTRLIEKAVLRLGASVGLLYEANRLPVNKGAGVLAMLDPAGDLFTSKDLTMQDGTIRTMHLPPDSAVSDLADYDALILTNQRHHNDIAVSGMYICDKATKQVLESRLASSMPEILLYLGHIVRGRTPAESGLVFLGNLGNPDASLLARELFSTKAWPMPQRVVFIGCGGARQESREWHGMAPASLCAGARLVLAAQWDLLWMELPGAPGKPWPTYQLALGALEAMKSADPVGSWRDRQLKELTQWRSAKHRVPIEHSPIFWSGIMAMGFID